MEPVFMVLGESAATAAVLALQAGVDVQAVDYSALAKRLRADRQVLEWHHPEALDPQELGGIVVDDAQAEFSGSWAYSTSVAPFVDRGYRHDGDARDGTCMAHFAVKLPSTGRYEVRLFYCPHGNRATGAPVTIRHADGETTVRVNQKRPPPIRNASISLGVYRFECDTPACVVICNDRTDGHVIADAVQFILER
jgi:hypothetical protein